MRPRSSLAFAAAAGAVYLANVACAHATPQPPVATARPTVAGIAAVGKQLTAQAGTWAAGGDVAYAYQWYRCDANGAACLSIHGAVSPTYTTVARDAAHTIGLAVTATSATTTGVAYASLVGPVAPAHALLESTAQPSLIGTATVGLPLQVATGAWSPTPLKLAYVWQRCNPNGRVCNAIASATGNSYTPTQADLGHALVAVVEGTFGTTTQSALSNATSAVAAAAATGPRPTAGPALAGTLQQGRQLTVSPGIWTGAGPIAYAYQWYRCDAEGAHCSSVHGATAPSYRLTGRDAGRTLGVTLRATDETGTAVVYTSLVGPIASPAAAIAATAPTAVGGSARIGAKLTASVGSWTAPPTSTTYTWLRCNANGRICTAIPGATSASYTVVAADLGHRLVPLVTADGTASSLGAATAPVA